MAEKKVKVEREVAEREIKVERENTLTLVQGIIPTGTKQIVENGTYDVSRYENAEVNVPGIDYYIGASI